MAGGRGTSAAGRSWLAAPLLDTSDEGLRAGIEADSIATRVVNPDQPHETHLDPDVAWVTGAPMDPYTNTVASAGFDPGTQMPGSPV